MSSYNNNNLILSNNNIKSKKKTSTPKISTLDHETFWAINENMDVDKIKQKIGVLDPEGNNINPLNFKPFSAQYKYTAETGDGKDITTLTKEQISNKIKTAGRHAVNKGGWRYGKVYNERNLFFQKLMNSQVMLVIAGTGTGKTVAIPKLLMHYFGYRMSRNELRDKGIELDEYKKPKILITIPRVKMAVSAGGYAATCMDSVLGEEVGYVTGEYKKYGSRTQLLYATTPWTLAYMIGNPDLDEYSALIMDEAHYREVDGDVLMSMVCDLIQRRPEFKLIIMSATMSPEPFQNYFNRMRVIHELYEPQGAKANYKISNIFQGKEIKEQDIEEKELLPALDTFLKSEKFKKGHVVVFVTSNTKAIGVIEELKKNINENPNEYPSIPWMHMISSKTSEYVMKICTGGETYIDKPDISGETGNYGRKLMFATEAVEASVTFDKDKNDGYGVDYVFDTGLKFDVSYDPIGNYDILGPKFVTQANIGQRCGRTGRTGDGYCIRLYTEKTFNSFPKDRIPEIESKDITQQLLRLTGLPSIKTYNNAIKFLNNMITPPGTDFNRVASFKLYHHGLLHKNGTLTNLGALAQKFGRYEMNMAKMIICSWYFQCVPEVLQLAAILSKINGNSDLINSMEMEKWNVSGSDHLSLLKIYMASRDIPFYKIIDGKNIKEDKRQQFAKYHNINYEKLIEIDLTYEDINSVFISNLINIIGIDLFNIKNHNVHNAKLKKINALRGVVSDGGGGSKKKKPKQKERKKTYRPNKKKKKTSVKIKIIAKPDIKLKRKPKPLNYDPDKEKQMIKLLNKISFANIGKMEITPFKSKSNNILACLFFGYGLNIGGNIGKSPGANMFVLRHPDHEQKPVRAKMNKTFNQAVKGVFSNFILYDKATYSFGEVKCSVVSKLPLTIIKKFIDMNN